MSDPSATPTLQPNVALRLMAVKQLLVEGDALAHRPDEPGRIQALLLLDLAIETALKLLLSARNAPVRPGAKFHELVAAAGKEQVSVQADVQRLHDARNGAQHQGLSPAVEEMENWRRVAGGCVRDVFSALGVAFETFTLADLVANPLVREPLEHALNLENMDYALALAAYGFYRLRGMYEEIAGPAIGLEMWVLGESRVADMLQTVKCADGKDDSVTAALSAMTHLGMGLDLDEYARFRWLTAGRIGLFDGDWKVSLEEEKFKVRVVTANDVLWVVDYVARQAVRLERNHAALRTFTEASIERDPRRMRDLKFLPVRFRQLGAG